MIKTLKLINQNFESSSTQTPQYLEFHRTFKKEFKELLKNHSIEIKISKPNHFDISGFFKLQNDKIYYFSIGDLRFNKIFMIRTAEHFKDYTGGRNNFIELNNNFQDRLLRFLGFNY